MVQPCLLFAGSAFESSPVHKLAKSMLLDSLRGQVVESLDLKVCPPVPPLGFHYLIRWCDDSWGNIMTSEAGPQSGHQGIGSLAHKALPQIWCVWAACFFAQDLKGMRYSMLSLPT